MSELAKYILKNYGIPAGVTIGSIAGNAGMRRLSDKGLEKQSPITAREIKELAKATTGKDVDVVIAKKDAKGNFKFSDADIKNMNFIFTKQPNGKEWPDKVKKRDLSNMLKNGKALSFNDQKSGRSAYVFSEDSAKRGAAAHEIGHTANAQGKVMGSKLFRVLLDQKLKAGLEVGNAFTGMMGGIDRDIYDGSKRKGYTAAQLALTTVKNVPTLIDEAAATHKAYKMLKNKYGKEEAKKNLKGMRAAFGSYAVPAAGDTINSFF